MQGRGRYRVEEFVDGTFMRARLEGQAFHITPVGSEVQQLRAIGFREWRWDVIPISSGSHSLFFTVSVLYEDTLLEEKVFERRINIAVNPAYSLSRWLGNNWGALIAGLVGAVGIVETIRRLRRGHKEK